MPDSAANWVGKLAAKPLPALRESIHQVRLMLDSPSVNHVRLSNFVEFDPGFCVHVFRAMNRLPKRPKQTITKLSNVLPMLGMGRVSSATRELKAAESVLKKKPLAGLIDCFSRAAHAAIYAQILARHRDVEAPTEYAVAALLHDIGEMALWVQTPDLMETISLHTARGAPRDEVAREILGCTIEQISVGISRTWELPALTIEAQDLSNSYREAPLTVMLSAALARSTTRGWNIEAARDHIELFGEFLDMDSDAATGYFHALAADAARRLTGRGFVLPAFGLIQQRPVILPQAPALKLKTKKRSATPADQAKAKAKAEPGPAPEPRTEPRPDPLVDRTKAAAAPSPEPRTKPRPGPASDRPAPSKQPTDQARPTAHKPQPRPSPAGARNTTTEQPAARARSPSALDTISVTLGEMLGQEQIQRLMFAVLTRDRKGLKCRLAMDVPTRPSLKGFSLGLERAKLFSALLKKPQLFWLNHENKTKFLPTIPSQARDILGDDGFLLMSVFVKNRPVGILYADSGNSDTPLTAESYSVFKNSCQHLVKTLNQTPG